MRKRFLLCCMQAVVLLMAAFGYCAAPGNMKAKAPENRDHGVKQTELAKKSRQRVALIIGNSRYVTAPLRTPANDAHALAATLRRLGFIVEERSDLGHVAMKKAMVSFAQKMKGAEVGLFFYAGHGVQVQGKNFLVPVNAKINSEKDIRDKAVAADLVVETMKAAKARVNVVVMDASHGVFPSRSFRPISKGLAIMDAPAGTIIASSTTANMTSVDSGSNAIGLYAQALIHALDTPGLNLADIFHQVRADVVEKTATAQIPWEYSMLVENLILVPPFDSSRSRLQSISDAACVGCEAELSPPLREFSDPLTSMEFMPVPGGCFLMGDTSDSGFAWEKPVHVACVNDFAIGKYEVTQGQWQRVMGDNPSHFNACGGNCPVEMVSWNDAQEFIRKLNKQTGGTYRLPTEAEWEYAARSGGNNEKYSGGNVDAVAWYNQNADGVTHQVGGKQANGLGINDMSGNVWEWVQDWYGYYNSGRQENPIGPASGTFRVFRGGGWSHGSENARTTIRYYNIPASRLNFLGLRLATSSVR